MMKKEKWKLTIDRPAAYEIKVPGHLDESLSVWTGMKTITVESEDDVRPISTLTCTVDQAALHGILRQLYAIGLPLISVVCIEVS